MMVVLKQSSRHKMWTETTRRKYEREGRRYASDLTDAEWGLIEPHMPAAKPLGRPREIELRAVLDAILYIARTGCQWRMLPKDFPSFTMVQGYFELLLQAREAAGLVVTMRPRRSKAVSVVCHEHIDRSRRCGAVQEMRVGPSRSVIRCRPQTAASCGRQERPW